MRRSAIWITAALGIVLGCGASHEARGTDADAATSGAAGPESDAGSDTHAGLNRVCDGSDDIRLGMWTDGGSIDRFMHPFGWEFAFVDGRCRYHASTNAMIGIASGVLDAAQADQLARDVGYAQIAAYSSYVDEVCFEGSPSVISDGERAFGCGCECDDTSPAGLADAEAASHRWIQRLVDQGRLSTGTVRAAATVVDSGLYADSPTWPLTRPIADIVVPARSVTRDAGAVIDVAEDANALRALRTAAMAKGYQGIYVIDQGRQYFMYVRDELPAATDAAVKTFRSALGW